MPKVPFIPSAILFPMDFALSQTAVAIEPIPLIRPCMMSLPIENKSIFSNGSLIKSTTLLNASDVFFFNVSHAFIAPSFALLARLVTVSFIPFQMDDASPFIPFQTLDATYFMPFQIELKTLANPCIKKVTNDLMQLQTDEASLFIHC